jgi:hypothetical protein
MLIVVMVQKREASKNQTYYIIHEVKYNSVSSRSLYLALIHCCNNTVGLLYKRLTYHNAILRTTF